MGISIGSSPNVTPSNVLSLKDAGATQETPNKPPALSGQDGVELAAAAQFAADVLIDSPPVPPDLVDDARPNRPYPSPISTPNTR